MRNPDPSECDHPTITDESFSKNHHGATVYCTGRCAECGVKVKRIYRHEETEVNWSV